MIFDNLPFDALFHVPTKPNTHDNYDSTHLFQKYNLHQTRITHPLCNCIDLTTGVEYCLPLYLEVEHVMWTERQ